MLKDLEEDLKEGILVEGRQIYAKNIDQGRINNQKYFEIYLKHDDLEKMMFYMSIYNGKDPYYKPWVEIFGINNDLYFNEGIINYFETIFEDKIINLISKSLGSGGRIFIEYSEDKETRYGLLRNYPEVITRLGYKLFEKGFTWFKDWYYPEGFNEGGEKLQAEKPIDEEHRVKHLTRIKKEVEEFLEGDFDESKYYERAEERAMKMIDDLRITY